MFFNGLLGAIAAQGQSIVAKAILWLNPTVPSIGTTDPISPWIDVGLAPAENATNATPANRPALIADIANGFPGAQYDGVNDTLNAPLVLPLPWTMAIALKIPTKPGSKKYILGKAGTGGIYIAPVTGYVGVDLGGVGIEGTVDRTGSFIPANDSFSASGTDSGVGGIGDIPNARWTEEANGGTIAVTDEKLKMTCPGGAGVKTENVVNAATIGGTGNFTASAAFSNLSLPGGSGVAELRVYSGSDIYIWYRSNEVGGTGQTLRMFKLGSGSGLKYDEANSTTAGTLRIVRDSATTLRFYLGAALKYTATISSGAAFDVTRLFLRDSQGDEGGTNTVDWDDFSLLDAAGEPITISTGVSPMISVHAVAEEVIVSIPVSDFFTAIPDSLVIGDTYWDSRWTKTINTTNDVASESITGNDLVITVNPLLSSENQAVFYTINQSSDHSGDFYFEMPLTVANVDNPGGPEAYLWLTVGGTFHFIGYSQGASGDGWFWRVGGTWHNFDSSLNGTKTLIIQRVGSTVTFKDGTTILGTNTNSGDVSIIRFIAANNGGGPQITQDVTFTYGYLKALDGVGGNPIEIVETSQEATLYVNGVEEATGAIGAGTLPSIDVIEAGLAADVPEVQIYDEALSSEEITQIASELSIYQ